MSEDVEGWGASDIPNDGYISEGELNTQQLLMKQNRKNKKSGGFQSMGLSANVFRGVIKKGYKVPTPIQRKTIPLIMEGKDVVAMARTGSGKTACFLIPMFERLKVHGLKSGARALILSPTRELALQTLKFTKEVGRFTHLRAAVVLGGDSFEGQFEAIHENPDIIIATPGRFVHICIEMDLKLNSIEYVVFDEADRLFEMGFSEQLREILSRLPEQRVTVLFSATLPKMMIDFARAGLTDPILIRLDLDTKLSENLKLCFFKVNSEDKLAVLFYMLRNVIQSQAQTVIFAATKHHVEYIHMALDAAKIDNTYIYSSLDQTARKINIAKFQTKKVRCLIVTDIAARGIDIPLLDNVINFHFPGKPKLFVHRVGRVARAGRSGVAYSLVAPDEAPFLLDLHLFLSQSIKFAPHPPHKDTNVDCDRIYGRVPQNIIENESSQVLHMHKTSTDLTNMKRVIENAYKQYTKSRPLPSQESIRRMKEEAWARTIGFHPLLITGNEEELDEKRISMLDKLKSLRPKTTVFEITKTKKTSSLNHMQEKRAADDHYINAFYKKVQAKADSREEKELMNDLARLETCEDEHIADTFSAIIGSKRSKGPNQNETYSREMVKKRKYKENIDTRDKDFYIPYAPDDRFTEQGYQVGTSFEKDAATAVMNLTQDEDPELKKQNGYVKWDRYKKKFVGTQGNQSKRIKTEAGVWISASYKSDKYKKWIAQGRLPSKDNESDKEDIGGKMKTIHKRGLGKKHPLLKGQIKTGSKRLPPKREVKTEAEIMKARRIAENLKLKNMPKKEREKLVYNKGIGVGKGKGDPRGRGARRGKVGTMSKGGIGYAGNKSGGKNSFSGKGGGRGKKRGGSGHR